MTGATLADSWKNNFRFQLNLMRQSMLSDALPPLDLECPSCTNSSLGLRCAEYLREGAQNTAVWKVEAKKRGSERDRMTEQNHVQLTSVESQRLKKKNSLYNILFYSSAWVLILGKGCLLSSR